MLKPIYDNRGTVVKLADENGESVGEYAYDAWGMPLYEEESGAGNKFGWQSNWIRLEDSPEGMLLSPTRIYSAKDGKFLQRDMLGFVDSLNLYEGFVNIPVNSIDSYGFQTAYESYLEIANKPKITHVMPKTSYNSTFLLDTFIFGSEFLQQKILWPLRPFEPGGNLLLGMIDSLFTPVNRSKGLVEELGYQPPEHCQDAYCIGEELGNIGQDVLMLWMMLGCPRNFKPYQPFANQIKGRMYNWSVRSGLIHETPMEYFPTINLGSGRNPMPGAYNVDINPYPGVNVVIKPGEKLPFPNNYFFQAHSINPYPFQPANTETARILQPGGLLYTTGQPRNQWVSSNISSGFKQLWQGPIITEHQFGIQRLTTGEPLNTSTSITIIYQNFDK